MKRRTSLKKTFWKKLLGIFLLLVFAFTLVPINLVLADSSDNEIDLSDNTTLSGYRWYLLNNVFNVSYDVTITQATTTDRVVINGGTAENPLKITLKNMDIRSTNVPITLSAGAHVILSLEGSNSLTSTGSYPALQTTGATLIIQGSDTDNLTVVGGPNSAGIGGSPGSNGGTVTINGGSITATGGNGAAGIGGGRGADGGTASIGAPGGSGGTVTINGGTVTATGGAGGVGIGGGAGGNGGGGNSSNDGRIGGAGGTGAALTINGGTVNATGRDGAAGVGGGTGGTGGTGFNGTAHKSGEGGAGGYSGSIDIHGGKLIVTGGRIGGGNGGNGGTGATGPSTTVAGGSGGTGGTGGDIYMQIDTGEVISSTAGIGGGNGGVGGNGGRGYNASNPRGSGGKGGNSGNVDIRILSGTVKSVSSISGGIGSSVGGAGGSPGATGTGGNNGAIGKGSDVVMIRMVSGTLEVISSSGAAIDSSGVCSLTLPSLYTWWSNIYANDPQWTGTQSGVVPFVNSSTYKYVKIDTAAVVENVTISGVAGKALVTPQKASITLYGDRIASPGLSETDASSWFDWLPEGLSVKATAPANTGTIALYFSGVPEFGSKSAFDITIPGHIISSLNDKHVVANPNAKFDIDGFEGVRIDPASVQLEVGETVQLSATVYPADAPDKSVTWTSGDPSIATVSETGLVTGVAYGSTTVTAETINGGTATCDIMVGNIGKAAAPIASPPGGTVSVGTVVTLTSATYGASIYYTTDGTTPDKNSTLFTKPISIMGNVTIKAFAVKERLEDSDISSFTYVVPTGLVIRAGSSAGGKGSQATVPVAIDNCSGVSGFMLDIAFDPMKLTLISINHDTLGGDWVEGKGTEGVSRVLWVGNEPISSDCLLYTITFRIAESCPEGVIPLTISGAVTDRLGGKLNVAFSDGSINVSSSSFGDINGDGLVDISDVVLLKAYLLGDIAFDSRQMLFADVYSDGRIDASDLLALMQYIAGGYGIDELPIMPS